MDSKPIAPLAWVLVNQVALNRVLRWRLEGQVLSRLPEEMREMVEDLMQHAGGMVATANILVPEACARGDLSHTDIDLQRFGPMCFTHDHEELVLGDKLFKDAAYYKAELRVIVQHRALLYRKLYSAAHFDGIQSEYKARETDTARYAKVIDELQAWLFIIATRGFDRTTRDLADLESIEGYRLSAPFATTRRVMDFLAKIILRPELIPAEIPLMPFDT